MLWRYHTGKKRPETLYSMLLLHRNVVPSASGVAYVVIALCVGWAGRFYVKGKVQMEAVCSWSEASYLVGGASRLSEEQGLLSRQTGLLT